MIGKQLASVREALADIRDGAVVMVGGFGSVGQLDRLLEGLIEQGARVPTIVANNAGSGQSGLAGLLATGRVRRIVCSYPRSAGAVVFEELSAPVASNSRSCPREGSPSASAPPAPGSARSIRRPASGPGSPRARKSARSTAGRICWKPRCTPMSHWCRPGGPIAGAISCTARAAVGARRVWVMTEHTTKDGRPKLVETCTLPLTALGIVSRIYTNLATIDIVPSGGLVVDMVAGIDRDALQALTGATLQFGTIAP